MNKRLFLPLVAFMIFSSCENDETDNTSADIPTPATYVFERNGSSTVNFSGQTTRLAMGGEIVSALLTPSTSAEQLKSMFAHVEGTANFRGVALNASDKNMRSKTAASADFFSANTAEQALIRADFDAWLTAQVVEIFPSWQVAAAPGVAGQIADGSATRYINAKGIEFDQLWIKGQIGALCTDQALNNYLSPAVLDAGSNRANNDAEILVEGQAYTSMEHLWDEAYGYVYGLNANPADPNADLGADEFLNKYVGRVEGDEDFEGIADELFQAFKLGRAAIVAKNYEVRDAQAEIIKLKISEIIGTRVVFYLQQAKNLLGQEVPDYGAAFHDISEGYGFIYSLQFTRKPNSDEPYFTKAEVDAFLIDLMDDGPNGLWDVELSTLENMAIEIAARFEFSLEAASE